MKEVSICFRACETSTHITQQPALSISLLHLSEFAGAGLRIIGVMVNGAPRRFRAITTDSVSVSPPIPFECARVELRCIAPAGPPQAASRPIPMVPSPPDGFGLQRPSINQYKAHP